MKAPVGLLVLFVLITLAVGAFGGWLGVRYGEHVGRRDSDLNAVIHEKLDLTSAQKKQISTLEKQFAARRRTLEVKMRAANRDLAAALDADHALSSRARMAIAEFHSAQEELQEATIAHVLAMRAVLTKQQSRTFDRAVHEALTAGPP